MSHEEVGKMIKKLRAGETVSCPLCRKGEIIPKEKDKMHFHCNTCDFRINID